MDSQQDKVMAAMRQVQNFMNAAPTPELAAINALGVRTSFDTAVSALAAAGVAQKQTTLEAQGETSKLKTLRTALLDAMARISTIAQANLPTVPEFSSMKMPRSDIHSAQLITAATAMGNAVTPYATTFTGEGLPSTYVGDLAAAAAALQGSIDGRKALKAAGVGATAGAAEGVKGVKTALKTLNSFVAPELAKNPTLLAQWKNAKKISAKPGGVKTTPITPTPPTPPVPPTPAPTVVHAAPTTSTQATA